MEGCRAATTDDLTRIVELARRHREDVTAHRGGALWRDREALAEPLDESYRSLIADPDACVLVGTIDDVVIGFGVGSVETLRTGETLGLVHDLYVEPEAREIGVGEEIAAMLIAYFEARDCVAADAWALPGDRATKNFFEDHGFVARGIVVHKRLGGADAS